MKAARGHISTLVWTAIFLALLSPHAHAQPAPEPGPAESTGKEAQELPKQLFAVATGVSYFPNLSTIEPPRALINPEKFGRFDGWGFNFEVAYHRQLVQWDSADLYIGGDVGLFAHGNTKKFDVRFLPSGETTQGEIFARGFYLIPSAKVVLKRSHSWRPFLGAGAGYYLLDSAELIDDPFGGSFEADELFQQHAFGGYVSLGMDISLSSNGRGFFLRLEGKVHLVSFVSLDNFAPGSSNLNGPIHMIQFGIVWD